MIKVVECMNQDQWQVRICNVLDVIKCKWLKETTKVNFKWGESSIYQFIICEIKQYINKHFSFFSASNTTLTGMLGRI